MDLRLYNKNRDVVKGTNRIKTSNNLTHLKKRKVDLIRVVTDTLL